MRNACGENERFIERVILNNPTSTAYRKLTGFSGNDRKLYKVVVTSKVILMLRNVT